MTGRRVTAPLRVHALAHKSGSEERLAAVVELLATRDIARLAGLTERALRRRR